MDNKEIEKRIERCEKIAKLQLEKAVELSESILELNSINKKIQNLEIRLKTVDHEAIRELKILFQQTQKTIATIVDKINKGDRQ